MNKQEDEKRGNLTVTINYIELAQDINCAIYFLQRLKDKLDKAAIDRGAIERERRNGDRRKSKNKTNEW